MPERRHSFRIDDYIDLECRQIAPDTATHTPVENLFPGSAALKVYAELKKIDGETSQLLYQIKDRDRHLAEYLHLLNRKIDLLAQQLISEPNEHDRPERRRSVNISDSGIAFEYDQPLERNRPVALNLVFLPTFVGVPVYALVTRCEPGRNGSWEIAAEFHQTSEAQLQLISQQIMRAQMADKRRQQN